MAVIERSVLVKPLSSGAPRFVVRVCGFPDSDIIGRWLRTCGHVAWLTRQDHVLDRLPKRQLPTHFDLDQAVEAAGRIGAKQTYFTHIAHELGHAETNANLPANMALAYDGQVVEL